MTTSVRDNPELSRYEIHEDGELLGTASYRRTDALVVLGRTEVRPSLQGRGIGGDLVRGALDHIRGLGLPVRPTCSFVEAWMRRNPEYLDLHHRQPSGTVAD